MNSFNTFFMAAGATFMLIVASYKQAPTEHQLAVKNQAFVGKQFVMTSMQVNPAIDYDGDGQLDTNLMTFLRPCDKDNTIVFEENGKVSGSTGQITCSTEEASPFASKPSHWTYNAQTSTIRIVKDSDATNVSEWKVVESSTSGLTVAKTNSDRGQTYTTTMALKIIDNQ